MRSYQTEIINAINNKGNWGGNNTVVRTKDNVTEILFYGNMIGVLDHSKRTALLDNCGYKNACTTSRINAIQTAIKDWGYNIAIK